MPDPGTFWGVGMCRDGHVKGMGMSSRWVCLGVY